MLIRKIFILFFMILPLALPRLPVAQAEAALTIDDDRGDFTYFNSNYPSTSGQTYFGFLPYPKSEQNSIVCGRLDYKNKNRDDRMIFSKNDSESDCYADWLLKKPGLYRSAKTYSYFCISGEFMLPQVGTKIFLFQIRDASLYEADGNKTTRDQRLATILPDGTIQALNGISRPQYVREGEWFTYRLYVDLVHHTADIYLNGEAFVTGMPFLKDLEKLDRVRLSLDKGIGSLHIRDLDITGMEQPYTGGTQVRSSIFYDDQPIRSFLENKTAFHCYGKTMYFNNKKEKMTGTPYYTDGKWYITGKDFNKAFGGSFVSSNEAVPLLETAEKKLGKYGYDDGNSLLLFANVPLTLEADTPFWQRPYRSGVTVVTAGDALNDFMVFERPSTKQLSALFSADETPSLFASKEDFHRIYEAAKTDSLCNTMLDELLEDAEGVLGKPEIDYVFSDSFRMFSTACELEYRMRRLGFAYQMTGNERYAKKAWLELEALCSFPDWNTAHIIDTGMFLAGIGIAYDWMGEAFTGEQRDMLAEAAIQKGIRPLNEAFYGRLPGSAGATEASMNLTGVFPKWASNYNTVANGGLIVAALAFASYDRELCLDTVRHAVRSLEYSMRDLAPSGGWNEGPSYLGYALMYLQYGVSAMEHVFGTDFGLMNAEGAAQTAEFILSMQSSFGLNNFHDSEVGESGGINDPNISLLWLAKRFDDGRIQDFRRKQLVLGECRANQMELFYYEAQPPSASVEEMEKLLVTQGTEAFSIRSGYGAEDTYLSAHGGLVNWYHAHNDAGAFVLDMLGERWAVDLGKEDYNIGLSDRQIYRKRTEGHNTVTINNSAAMNQNLDAFVPLCRYAEGASQAYAVYDMTQAYADVSSYQRGFFSSDDFQSVMIRDEMVLTKQSEVYWFMHTNAEITVLGNEVILTQNGKAVSLTWQSNATQTEVSAMDAVALDNSFVPNGQSPNEGVRKVAIKLTGNGAIRLTVKISALGGLPPDTPISQWQVTGTGEQVDTNTVFHQDFSTLSTNFSSGLYGRSSQDKSLCLSGEESFAISGGETSSGKTSALSFYAALSSADASVRLWTNANGTGYTVAEMGTDVLTVWGKEIPLKEKFVPNRWYRFDIYTRSGIGGGIDGNVTVYVDGTCVAANQRISAGGTFAGFGEIRMTGSAMVDDLELTVGTGIPNPIHLEDSAGDWNIIKYGKDGMFFVGEQTRIYELASGWRPECVSDMVFRDALGAEQDPLGVAAGSFLDVSLVDGTHRFISCRKVEKNVIYRQTGMISIGSWHQNNAWSWVRRSQLVSLRGLGGKDQNDISIGLQGPYRSGNATEKKYHDYLDYVLQSDQEGQPENSNASLPLSISGSLLLSSDIDLSLALKAGNETYRTFLFLSGGKIYLKNGVECLGSYQKNEWIPFTVRFYPGKQEVELDVGGMNATAHTVLFESDNSSFLNLIRFGVASYREDEMGFFALDDVTVSVGCESEAQSVAEPLILQDGRLLQGAYRDGLLTIAVQEDLSLPQTLVAGLYENGRLLEANLADHAVDGFLRCVLPVSKAGGTLVRVMQWSSLYGMKPLSALEEWYGDG